MTLEDEDGDRSWWDDCLLQEETTFLGQVLFGREKIACGFATTEDFHYQSK